MNAVDFVPTQRETLAGFIGDIERLEALFASWDETQRGAVEAYRLAIESLQAEAFRRLVRGLKADSAALEAMKQAASDEIVYAVLRRHNILKPSLSERVEAALDSVRPMLASHGGDVELVAVRPPVIEVRFTGACDGCPASALTFHGGVKKAVEEACPEITDILQLKGAGGGGNNDSVRFVSPFALGAVDGWHLVCRLDEIPQGDVVTRTVGGENVILSRQGAIVSCFQNACAHLGMEIDAGEVENGIITCPWHGFQYDLATGECLTAPEVQLQAHMVKVTGNRVEVRLAK
ncbi:NifU family protein [Roseivivax sediminis]|uniref:Ferredoxin subunit of nitrite reductase or a ring-hydroxylating dioxygenase n=1 Tax=Roseivivax sediminis TaxID=936889 RepID=A0A1I1XZD9_9RHOB|nr:NifU family protein [Roseivivax sediminis]SFE11173.1 Ferredoxin subunit of nitrite reductase or a ring-hydroxylating dioxygenase [Roseivivax sediminis]